LQKSPLPPEGVVKGAAPSAGEGWDEGILNQALILFYPLTLTLLCPSGCSRRERGSVSRIHREWTSESPGRHHAVPV